MLIRLILLVIVVFAVLWLIRSLVMGSDKNTSEKSREMPKTEDMQQCKFCGTHVPESLLITSNNQPYCCQDHAERDQS